MKTCFVAILAIALLLAFCSKTRINVQLQTGEDKEVTHESPVIVGISKEDAIEIAKDHAARSHALKIEDYKINAVAQDGEWRVVFDLKSRTPLTSGGVIEYHINKKTGEIIDSKVYQ